MLIEVKSKTNKPDGVPKKKKELNVTCRAGEEVHLATGRQTR